MIEFKEFDESWSSRSGFDITPMLDMIFILLIFFLLTASAASPVISADLPETGSSEAAEDLDVIVSIDRDGRLFLNKEQLSEAMLAERLKSLYSSRSSDEVFIESDKSVDFGAVIDVMDLCRESGAGSISFLVDEKENQSFR